MSVRSELLAAARALLVAVSGAPGAKVIVAESGKAPRPEKPYVTVRYTTIGESKGPAWRLNGQTGGGEPTSRMRERREAVLSFQGYGADSVDWLDAMQAGLDSPSSITVQAAQHIAARLQSGVRELSALLDTGEEQRFSLELRFGYLNDSAVAEGVAAETVEVHTELRRSADDGDTLISDQTVQLS